MIGIFDSGYGGLTILREITKQLPQYDYAYFGDNANAPYGEKEPEEIYELTKKGVEFLFSRGCNLVILACNTASAVALRRLQQEWLPNKYPDKKVLGIIVSTIEQITGVPWSFSSPYEGEVDSPLANLEGSSPPVVAILATPATVKSGAYEHEVHKRNPNIKVVQQSCPKLVSLIESAAPEGVLVKELSHCLSSLRGMRLKPHAEAISSSGTPSALLLGCTHYALISHLVKPMLEPGTQLLQQPGIVASSLKQYLKRHPDIVKKLAHTGTTTFYTSGPADSVSRTAQTFFGKPISFRGVDKPDKKS